MFSPPSARPNFFKCAPPPPNLKSWIRPCKSTLKSRGICINASNDNLSLFIVDRTYVFDRRSTLNDRSAVDFVFHFFLNFHYSLFFQFCFFFFFLARRCARNCVLAYRELRACYYIKAN